MNDKRKFRTDTFLQLFAQFISQRGKLKSMPNIKIYRFELGILLIQLVKLNQLKTNEYFKPMDFASGVFGHHHQTYELIKFIDSGRCCRRRTNTARSFPKMPHTKLQGKSLVWFAQTTSLGVEFKRLWRLRKHIYDDFTLSHTHALTSNRISNRSCFLLPFSDSLVVSCAPAYLHRFAIASLFFRFAFLFSTHDSNWLCRETFTEFSAHRKG